MPLPVDHVHAMGDGDHGDHRPRAEARDQSVAGRVQSGQQDPKDGEQNGQAQGVQHGRLTGAVPSRASPECTAVDQEVNPYAGRVAKRDGPGPAKMGEEGVDAARLSHHGDAGG